MTGAARPIARVAHRMPRKRFILCSPLKRINAGFSGYYNLTDSIDAYAEFGFTEILYKVATRPAARTTADQAARAASAISTIRCSQS